MLSAAVHAATGAVVLVPPARIHDASGLCALLGHRGAAGSALGGGLQRGVFVRIGWTRATSARVLGSRPAPTLGRRSMPTAGRRTRRLALLASALVAVAATAGCTLAPGERRSLPRTGVRELQRHATSRTGADRASTETPENFKLDLYQPTGDTVTKRPALLWIHGGGFTRATRAARRAMRPSSRAWDTSSRRSTTGCSRPSGAAETRAPRRRASNAALGAQHDAQAAVARCGRRAAYKLDTGRIASGGGSAGAVASLLVDWRPEDPGTSGNPGFASKIEAAVSISGGVPTNEWIDPSDWPAISSRHGGHDGPLRVGGAERRGYVRRRASSRCSTPSRAPVTASGSSR